MALDDLTRNPAITELEVSSGLLKGGVDDGVLDYDISHDGRNLATSGGRGEGNGRSDSHQSHGAAVRTPRITRAPQKPRGGATAILIASSRLIDTPPGAHRCRTFTLDLWYSMPYSPAQRLNEWVAMLHRIYGNTQNYSKSSYEIHTHLTEVTGAFGKMLLKKKNPEAAVEFLPKMFSWAVALFTNVRGRSSELETALLAKYPRACSYCLHLPCSCWQGEKPDVNQVASRDKFFVESPRQGRSINDLQLMFRSIYGGSWGVDEETDQAVVTERITSVYTRMVEELSEIAEAIRFHHLYPSNFENEIADYFAWWFALVSILHRVLPNKGRVLLAEEVLWAAYPGFCVACGLSPCDCRPGPVRELLSKPSINELAYLDALTQAGNRAAFDLAVSEMSAGAYPVAHPIACVRIDLDSFKSVNDDISHAAGDAALRHVVASIRRKARQRDRVFRVGGDEFVVLCQDLSALEAEGMMRRVAAAVKAKPIRGLRADGTEIERTITLSVGIVECASTATLSTALEQADHAAIRSKEAGKDRITINPSS